MPSVTHSLTYRWLTLPRQSLAARVSLFLTNLALALVELTQPTLLTAHIQEGSFDWTQTFWRNPQYGAVQLVTQTSYVTRAPWFVATDPGTAAQERSPDDGLRQLEVHSAVGLTDTSCNRAPDSSGALFYVASLQTASALCSVVADVLLL